MFGETQKFVTCLCFQVGRKKKVLALGPLSADRVYSEFTRVKANPYRCEL